MRGSYFRGDLPHRAAQMYLPSQGGPDERDLGVGDIGQLFSLVGPAIGEEGHAVQG